MIYALNDLLTYMSSYICFFYWWSSSTNDGIPKGLCSLTYITINTTMEHIETLGPGTASKN